MNTKLEKLITELTKKFVLLKTKCECQKLELEVQIVEERLKEAQLKTGAAYYASEAARHSMEMAESVSKTQVRIAAQTGQIIRPSTSMPVQVTYDAQEWHCTLGDVDAIGVTPETACQEFDRLWLGKDELE